MREGLGEGRPSVEGGVEPRLEGILRGAACEGVLPRQVGEIRHPAVVARGDAVRERGELRVRTRDALEGAERAVLERAAGLDGAIAQLHVIDGGGVLGRGEVDAKGGPGNLARERAGDATDAVRACELTGGWAIVNRGAAARPEHPRVEVCLDDGMNLAAGII